MTEPISARSALPQDPPHGLPPSGRPSQPAATGRPVVAYAQQEGWPLDELLRYLWDLLRELVARDLRLRYKRSILGIAWSLVTPLAQLLVLRFVFTVVLPLDVPNYTAFLFLGLLVWGWLSGSLEQAAGSIVDNRELIRLAGFPTAVLPIVSVAANLVLLAIALPVLGLFLIAGGSVPITTAPLWLPLLIGIQFVFTLSVSYFIAALQVTFRDVKHLLQVALMLGFYITPVFYEVRQVPARFGTLYAANPMVHLLTAYRDVLLHGRSPSLAPLLGVLAASLVILATGYAVFSRASATFVDDL